MSPESATEMQWSHQRGWLALAFCAALWMSGCASMKEGSSGGKAEAWNFALPPGRAGVYVIRPFSVTGPAERFRIRLDSRDVGLVSRNSFIFGTVAAGPHVLEPLRTGGDTVGGQDDHRSVGPGSKSAIFNAEAGQNYFFTVKGDWVGLEFEEISDTAGQKYVRKLKLSGR